MVGFKFQIDVKCRGFQFHKLTLLLWTTCPDIDRKLPADRNGDDSDVGDGCCWSCIAARAEASSPPQAAMTNTFILLTRQAKDNVP